MSDDLVKRYQLDYHHTRTYAEMAEDCDGDWVKYSAYKAASDRIEQIAATNEELEAKLAKAVKALEYYGGWSDESSGICGFDGGSLARTTLAELKGQDDE